MEILSDASTADVRHHLGGRALLEGLEPVRGEKKETRPVPDADRQTAAASIRAAIPALRRRSTPRDDILGRLEADEGLRPSRA